MKGSAPEHPIIFRNAPLAGMEPGSSKWRCCCCCHVITGTKVLLSIQIAVTLFVAYRGLSGYVNIRDGCPIFTLLWILLGTIPPGLVLWGIRKSKPSLFVPYLAVGAARLLIDGAALILIYFVRSVATYVIERYTMPMHWSEPVDRNGTNTFGSGKEDNPGQDNFTRIHDNEPGDPMRIGSNLYINHYRFTMCVIMLLTILYCAEVYLYFMVVKGYRYMKVVKRNYQASVTIHDMDVGPTANYGTDTKGSECALPPPYTYGGYAQATLNYGAGSGVPGGQDQEVKVPIPDEAAEVPRF